MMPIPTLMNRHVVDNSVEPGGGDEASAAAAPQRAAPPAPPPPVYAQPYGAPTGAPQPPPQAKPEGEWDTEAQKENMLTPDLPVSVRHGFIRKVYGLLFIQLLITFGIMLVFTLVTPAADWIKGEYWVVALFGILAFIIIIALMCCKLDKKYPVNVLLMTLFSICFGFIFGAAGAWVGGSIVAQAVGVTVLVVVAISLFACQTRFDFTGFGPYLMILLLILFVFGFVIWFVPGNNTVYSVYAGLGVFVFSCYLIFDTQLIIGGKHRKNEYSIDDYLLACLSLYMDIINMFAMILALFSMNS
eukprot:Polyplicarium_translucidae@DN3151_c0_g1_i3.p1